MTQDLKESPVTLRRRLFEPLLAAKYATYSSAGPDDRSRLIKHIARLRKWIFPPSRPTYAYVDIEKNQKILVNLCEHEALNMKYGIEVEPFETHIAEKLLTDASVFADVGANIGIYTLLASRFMPDDGHILSFEPDPRVFSQLNHNITTNNLKQVEAFNLALGATAEDMTLYVNADSGFNSLGNTNRGEVVEEIKVEVKTFDEVFRSSGLTRLDLMKIDVEGFEGDVLKGATETLLAHTPVVICELALKNYDPLGRSIADVMNGMLELGYEIWEMDRKSSSVRLVQDTSVKMANQYFLFVPKGRDMSSMNVTPDKS